MKKYAVLDTDFISKAYIARTDDDHHLIDLVMGFDNFEFYCHEKTVEELGRHTVGASPDWLMDHIADGTIKCYSDSDILNELRTIYKNGAYSFFCDFLKRICDTFEAGYFNRHFSALASLKSNVTENEFLNVLTSCENQIGTGESLGEKKSSILLQMLQLLFPGQVYIFCSDDNKARCSIMNIPDSRITCISMLSLFCELKYRGFTKAEVEPYFNAYEAFCSHAGQAFFKVWESQNVPPRKTRVVMHQVFDEIFDDKFDELGNGDLKYKSIP